MPPKATVLPRNPDTSIGPSGCFLAGICPAAGMKHCSAGCPCPSKARREEHMILLLVKHGLKDCAIVTYEDGTQIFGYFGQQSLASTDPNRSDLFLERLYDVDDDQQWQEKSPPRSALIFLKMCGRSKFSKERMMDKGQSRTLLVEGYRPRQATTTTLR